MALNPNHTFEELNEVKCSIVEKNCSIQRSEFLKKLLEQNNFSVVIAKSPPPKTVVKPAGAVESETPEVISNQPETFTVGVSDLSFNVVNAIYNRELKTPDGNIVSPSYWKQAQQSSVIDTWYWKK